MNYKKADDERIKKNRQAVDKGREKVTKQTNDLENRTYSGKALNALSKGEYSTLRGSTYNRVPELQPNNTRPSTRYQNQNVTTTRSRQSSIDERYRKDLETQYDFRYGDRSGERYYDPKTETSTEYWRKNEADLKKKYNLSDDQYKSLWNTYEKEKNQQIADTEVNLAKKTAKDSALLGTLQSFAYLPQAMIEGGATMLSNLLPKKYKAQNADDTNFTGTRVKQATRQTVKDEHIKSKGGQIAYDIGTGLGDMAISAGVPVLGTASLGAETAARNNMQALERGADPTRAALTGLTTGLVSGAMNKVGLDKALASGTIKEAAKKEGLENLLEDVVNLGLDKAINQNKSQLDTLKDYYTSQGMDDLSAWKQVIKDTGLDLATSYGSGALFGGLMKVPSLGKTPDVPNDVPMVSELTGDPTVDNAIKQTVDAEAEIQRLSEQIPKVPEVASESAPTLTPEGQANIPNNVESFNGYKVGDKVTYSTDDFDGKSSTESTIKEVYPDHMIVDVPGLSDHVWIDNDTMDMVKSSKSNNPTTKIDQIKEGIKAKNFRPVTFVNNEGHTYIISKSTRPGEKWQLSHIDDTGRPKGHSAFSNDNDLLATLDKVNTDDIANVGGDTILNQSRTTIGDMLNNPDDYSLDDFKRAVRAYDTNADVDGVEKEDIIAFFNNEAEGNPDVLTSNIPINRLVNNNTSETNTNINESAPKNPTITSKPIDKTKPIKEQLSPEDRASIFGGTRKGKRTQGLTDAVGYAKKFAGDTDEAKKLATECKKLLESYVESGDIEEYDALLHKIEDLDNLARNTKAEYKTKKGDVFTYDKYFTDFDEKGNEVPSSLLERFVYNRSLNNSVKKLQNARKAQIETTNAPTMDPAHDIAGRYAAVYQGFDTYDYMDNVFDNDSFVESMANDIENGRDLTQYIDALGDMIDDAPDENVRANMQGLMDELTALNEGRVDGKLSPDEVSKLQDVVDGKYDIPENGNEIPNTNIHSEDGQLLGNIKIPEYTMGEDVYFRGSDSDIARAEAEDQAIIDTFRNIISDPEFNALSFKNGNKEVFVSPATNGNGLRMSYTIDGVPTGHHDYSLDQIDDLSRNLRNEVGNGGEDIKVQRKSDIAKQRPNEVPNVKPTEPTPPVPPSNNEVPEVKGKVRSFSRRGSEDKSLPKEIRNVLKKDYYKVARNADTEAKANSLFDENNLTQTRSNLEQLLDKKDPASALLSYKLAGAYVDAKEYDAATDVLRQVSEKLTEAGQFTQAAKLAMVKNDPMAALRMYQRDLDSINQWGKEKYGKKWKKLKLTDADKEAFRGIKEGDAEALSDLVDNLNSRFGKEIPSTWWDKVVSATKTSMLLNPRTQVRNVTANMALLPIRSATDRVSALGQNIVHLIDPDVKVTQSLTGGSKEQKDIAGKIFDNMKSDILGENKMKDSTKSDILSHRQTFNDDFFAKWVDNLTNGGIGKLNEKFGADANKSTMETLQNFTYWLMGDFGDAPFVKKNFVNRLASYMKAQGINNIDDVPDDAIALATQEALKATFKDDNAFTKALQGVKQKTGKFGEVALPFTKTPANLAVRAYDYSPLGIISTIKKAKSGAEIGEVIDDLSKNLTGTAMILLGMKLRDKGILSGNYSDDKDEAAAQKRQGMLENAFHIGNKYFTYDWAQPAATPLVLGSVIQDAINASDEQNKEAKDIVNASWRGGIKVANTIINSSPLQSLSDMLGSSSYSDDDGPAENIAKEIIEFPQRFIPSVLGATARVSDPYYRETYTNDGGLTGILKSQVDSAKAKIPELSKTLPISYDTWGQARRRSNTTGEAALAQYVNPGQFGIDTSIPIDKDIQAIYDATGNNAVFPKYAPRSVDLGNDGTIKLDNRQHSEYQKELGQLSRDFAEGLLGNSEFKNLSDDQKAEMLGKAYNFANVMTKEKLFDHVTDSDKKLKEAYESGGVDGAVKYWINKSKADELGLTYDTYIKKESEQPGSAAQYAQDKQQLDAINEKYGTEISMSTYEKYGAQGVDQRAQNTNEALKYGFVDKDGGANIDSYEKAVSIVGNNDASLRAYSDYKKQGFEKNNQRVPYLLDNNSFSAEQKGMIIAGTNPDKFSSNTAKEVYKIGGYEGVWDYYMLKNMFDKDDSGGLNKKEKSELYAFMNSDSPYVTSIPDDVYYYLGSIKRW